MRFKNYFLLTLYLLLHSMSFAQNQGKTTGDTTVYATPIYAAKIPDPLVYFRTNNKFKDWDKNDKQRVYIKAIAEKDGSCTNIQVAKSSNNKKLDQEAVRLLKEAKLTPATNDKKTPVRSKFGLLVIFPPE